MTSLMRSSALALALVAALWASPVRGQAAAPAEAPPSPIAAKNYAPFPQPGSGYVTDLARVLTEAQEERIEQWLWQAEKKTGVEVIVVVLNSIKDYPGTPNEAIEPFATALFNAYGIGNMPRNDGVLLLVAIKDRKARIELGAAYGRNRDGDAERIMSTVITPRFKSGDYAGGIAEGTREILAAFANVRLQTRWGLIAMVAAVPVCVLVAVSLFRNGKRGWGWVVVGLIIVLLLAIISTVITIFRNMPRGRSATWSSGGSGGFGGGFSGGGGATGSW